MKHIKLFENFNNEYINVPTVDDRMTQIKKEYTIRTNPSISQYKKYSDEAIVNFKKTFNIFKDMVILWSNRNRKESNAVGEYIKTTSLNGIPIILLHEDTIKNISKKGNYTEEQVKELIQVTVYHELFHALVDVDQAYNFSGNMNIFKFKDEEEFVDTLAVMMYKNERLPTEITKVSNMFRGKQWKDISKDYVK